MRTGKRFLSGYVVSIMVVVSMALVLWNSTAAQASHSTKILHSFTGGSNDGTSNLTLSGSALYGMTFQGGSGGAGTIFRINLDGTGLILLHNFTGGISDGANPIGSLTLSGATLYGMTLQGGSVGFGTIFRINLDGTGFKLLHNFTSGISYGANPLGSLTLSGSTLYGVTYSGAANAYGTIFKIDTDGTGFQLLHSFTGLPGDGAYPLGSLTLLGSTLYGMTREGGDNTYWRGTIFKIDTDGTGFQQLHSFTGDAGEGAYPSGSLTLAGSTLYGMTNAGGTNYWGGGTIFKISTDGTGFQSLHSFTGSGTDGARPKDSLTLSGSTLYGMTSNGGINDDGTIFQINTDGTGFQLLRSFSRQIDGAKPQGNLTLSGSSLYGVTLSGDSTLLPTGTIFKIDTDGMGFQLLHNFAGGTSDGYYPQSSLTLSGSTLYGMTYGGGTDRGGTIFKIDTDGTGLQLLHSFAGGTSDGYYPQGSLTLSGSTLYGMTGYGGADGNGTVFKINTDGTGFQLLHSFDGSDGYNPQGSLILSGSTLYGMVTWGGRTWGYSTDGTIFKINTDGTGFQLLHRFAGYANDGSNPYGDLTLSGATLYGMTLGGGPSFEGTIFQINTDGTEFQLLHTFFTGIGSQPQGSLTLSGSTLYGMTSNGGPDGNGTIFKINTDGTGFQLLHRFTGCTSNIYAPTGSLTLMGSTLYGVTGYGGTNGRGTIFKIGTDGTGFQLVYSFAGGPGDGYYPQGSLIFSGATFYGMTGYGGISGDGTIFSLKLKNTLSPIPFLLLLNDTP